MTTTKKLVAKKTIEPKNPAGKTRFKRTDISISEVENGYEVEIQWGFNSEADSAQTDSVRDYVAKTEAEALELVKNVVPLLITCDVTEDE